MANRVLKFVKTKKTWAAPELKKIDVDEATAAGSEAGTDALSQDS